MTATETLAELLKDQPSGIQKLGDFVSRYLDEIGEIKHPLAITAVLHDGKMPVGVHVQPDWSISVVAPDMAFRVLPQQQCIDEYEEDGHTDVVENLRVPMLAGARVIACLAYRERRRRAVRRLRHGLSEQPGASLMTTEVYGGSSDDVRAHIAHVLDVTRDGLRRCLHERKMRMDEVFGYVHWENGLGAVVFVLPLTMRPEIVAEVAKNNPAEYAEMLSASIMRLDSEPAQGKLRTLIESHLGLFEVAVQMYPGAVA